MQCGLSAGQLKLFVILVYSEVVYAGYSGTLMDAQTVDTSTPLKAFSPLLSAGTKLYCLFSLSPTRVTTQGDMAISFYLAIDRNTQVVCGQQHGCFL